MNRITLKDCCAFQEGYVNPSQKIRDYFNGPIKWLRASDLNDGFVYNTEQTLSKKGFESAGKSAFLFNDNTIAISKSGTIGKLGILKDRMCGNRAVINIDVNNQVADLFYVFYTLIYKKQEVLSKAGGSIQKNLYVSALETISLNHKDLCTQKSIAKVLSDLDAKIELNNRINRELEAMAKTLYDYWFVQFDFPCLPADYRPSGQVNPNSELAQKIKAFSTYTKVGGLPLPDGKQWFVYILLCEDGSFYKGITNDLYRRFYEHYTGQGAKWTQSQRPQKVIHWEAYATQTEAREREEELKTGFGRNWIKREYEKLEKYGFITQDGLPAHQTRLMPAGKMVYNAELKREIPEGWEVKKLGDYANIKKGTLITENTADSSGKIKVVSAGIDFSYYHSEANYSENTITISASGANAGFINFWREPIFACDCTTVRGNNTADTLQILGFLKLRQKFLYKQARGSAQPHVYPKDIEGLFIPIPPIGLIEEFGKFAVSSNEQIANNIKQNQQLSALRDWLLPMLMNGQVTVKEAEERLSMAAEPSVEYKKN